MRGVVRVFALILNGPPRALPPGWAVTLRGVSPDPGPRSCSSEWAAVRRPSWWRKRRRRRWLVRVQATTGRGPPPSAPAQVKHVARSVASREAERRGRGFRPSPERLDDAEAAGQRRGRAALRPRALRLGDLRGGTARRRVARELHAPAGSSSGPRGRPRPRWLGGRDQPDRRFPPLREYGWLHLAHACRPPVGAASGL